MGVEISTSHGCIVVDTSGKEYLDLLSGIGVTGIGHTHPAAVKAIKAQAERYLHQALALMGEDAPEEQAVIFDHAGDIATALGKEGEARTHWQKVLELAPDNEEVRLKLEP